MILKFLTAFGLGQKVVGEGVGVLVGGITTHLSSEHDTPVFRHSDNTHTPDGLELVPDELNEQLMPLGQLELEVHELPHLGLNVGVAVGIGVFVGLGVFVGIGVGVLVGFGVGVSDGLGVGVLDGVTVHATPSTVVPSLY